MSTYLLDTNIVSYLLRNAPRPLVARLAGTPREKVAISVITAMELHFGLAKNPATRTREAVEAFLAAMPVATFPPEIAPVYGRIRAELERRGVPIGPMDTLIAAHAVAAGSTLVTNNVREFGRVPALRCEDWTKPRRSRA